MNPKENENLWNAACSVPCLFASKIKMTKECFSLVDAVLFNPPMQNIRTYRPDWRWPHQQYTLFLTESESIWKDVECNLFFSKKCFE